MSKAEVQRFTDDLKTDAALKDAVKAVGNEAELIELAKGKGYDFTLDELKAFAETMKGELSEEELERVAGGVVVGAVEILVGAVVVG